MREVQPRRAHLHRTVTRAVLIVTATSLVQRAEGRRPVRTRDPAPHRSGTCMRSAFEIMARASFPIRSWTTRAAPASAMTLPGPQQTRLPNPRWPSASPFSIVFPPRQETTNPTHSRCGSSPSACGTTVSRTGRTRTLRVASNCRPRSRERTARAGLRSRLPGMAHGSGTTPRGASERPEPSAPPSSPAGCAVAPPAVPVCHHSSG